MAEPTSDLAQRLLAARTRKPVDRPRRRLVDHESVTHLRTMFEFRDALDVPIRFFEPQRHTSGGHSRSSDDRDLLNFSAFDYLGLAHDRRVVSAAVEATERYGTSASAARIVGGEIDLFADLETALAEILGEPSSLTFVSGYLTNVSFLGFVGGPNDLIILDELAHNSMFTGAQLSGAKRLTYRHNDTDHLAEVLAAHRSSGEMCLVLTEGIYSMDGDVAPLPDILDVARRYQADTVVDEAHSFGVLGPSGAGIREHFGVPSSPDLVIMGTLSKALGSLGGFVAGDADLLEAVRYQAPGASLYCTAMTPSAAGAALAAVRILAAEPERVSALATGAAFLGRRLQELGLDTGLAQGMPVIPVLTGSSSLAVRLSHRLRELGVVAHPIFHPVVPDRQARVRFFVSAAHSLEDLEHTALQVARAADDIGLQRSSR